MELSGAHVIHLNERISLSILSEKIYIATKTLLLTREVAKRTCSLSLHAGGSGSVPRTTWFPQAPSITTPNL